MDRVENIVNLPASYITREVADRLMNALREVAEIDARAEYREGLERVAKRSGVTVEEALANNPALEEVARTRNWRRDRITFGSRGSMVQFVGRDVPYVDVPMDPRFLRVELPASLGHYIGISLSTDVSRGPWSEQSNTLVIRGSDRNWISGFLARFKEMTRSSRRPVRNALYRGYSVIALSAFLMLSLLELRAVTLIDPTFSLTTPLNGLSLLAAFFLLRLNYELAFRASLKVMQYVYPYFEFEDRISEGRKSLRTLWIATMTALYGFGLWALLSLL